MRRKKNCWTMPRFRAVGGNAHGLKRVAVLYTGGTIGMVSGEPQGKAGSSGGYQPGHALPDSLRQLIQRHALLRLHDWRIHTLQPLLDSANARPVHWYDLATQIWAQSQDCDAVVVLHGTDTMDYACALLAFLWQGGPCPIIFTGAQHPLGTAGSDAEQNLLDTLLCAVSGPDNLGARVVLCMGGQVLSGARLVKMGLDVAQGFQTPHQAALAQRQADGFVWHTLSDKAVAHDAFKTPPAGNTALAVLQSGDLPRVGVLRLYPGMPAQVLALMGEQHPDGLVLQSYGAGTGATDDPAFCAALMQLCQQGVPVIAVSQCPQAAVDLTTYETGRGLLQVGVLSGGDMTTAAAFAKLHWLTALRRLGVAPVEAAALQRWIHIPLVDEISFFNQS